MKHARWELLLDSVIYLPHTPEMQQRLREKLEEYRKRIEKFKKSYQSKKLGVVLDWNSNLLDAAYKAEIVEALLEQGDIEIRKIHDRIADEFDGYISEEVFGNAVSVINDYISSGGIHTEGGSGFFTDEMFQRLMKSAEVLEYPGDATERAELQNKYYEYLGRNVDLELREDSTIDRAAMKRNAYKVRILADLRERQRVIAGDLAGTLQREEGKAFDRVEFYNAMCQTRDLLERAHRKRKLKK
jgi:hypothetical protein